jgi:rhamnosyltransferase
MSGASLPIASVTVALNPDSHRLAEQLNSLALQVTHVILVDNGSRPPLHMQLGDLELPDSLIWVELPENKGIAGGLNAGISEASGRQAEFVICMDHDSLAPSGCVSSLHDGLVDLEQQGHRVAAVGPTICDVRDDRAAPFIKLGVLRHRHLRCDAKRSPIETDFLISSGCFARTRMYQDRLGVGPLDDSLFIDSVDFEWCCRARARGFLLYGICRATLDHRLGDSRQKLMGGWSIVVHSPTRLYYMTRNRIALYRRHYVPLRWKSKDVFRMSAKLLVTLLFLAPRRDYLKASVDGVLDALKGRSGAR